MRSVFAARGRLLPRRGPQARPGSAPTASAVPAAFTNCRRESRSRSSFFMKRSPPRDLDSRDRGRPEVYNRARGRPRSRSSFSAARALRRTRQAAIAPAGETLYAIFKTTCPTCELAWPFLDRIGRLAEGGALPVVAISQDGAGETTALRTGASAWNSSTLFDEEPWPASEALRVENVPTFLRVGKDGGSASVIIGFRRQKMQDLAAEAASLAGRATPQLFQPGENVPALKPG